MITPDTPDGYVAETMTVRDALADPDPEIVLTVAAAMQATITRMLIDVMESEIVVFRRRMN